MTLDLHHLAGAYALDALDADERRAFEAHFPTCEVCNAEVADYRATSAMLAEAVVTPPPSDLKARLMAEVAQTRQVAPILPDRVVDLAEQRRRRVRAPMTLAAVAAAAFLIVGIVGVVRTNNSTSATDEVLMASDAVLTSLEGEVGSLRVVWSDSLDQVALFGNELPGLAPGQAYALWFVQPDGVTAAGLFDPSDNGEVREVLHIADIDPTGWGVTIEPDTGSEQPTSDLVYIAEI